jgi:hypothetical protein
MKLDKFTLAYIECALWSTNDESNEQGGEPFDANYGIEDIAPEALEKIKADCDKFQADNETLLSELDLEQSGHDFWLTRNRHGAGFWDGDYNKALGDALTDASHKFGEVDLYLGDDGMIYQS